MTHLLLDALAMLAIVLILYRIEPTIARMGSETHWMVRYAMLLLAGAAAGLFVVIVSGGHIDGLTLILLIGIALLLVCERRISYLANIRKRRPHAYR